MQNTPVQALRRKLAELLREAPLDEDAARRTALDLAAKQLDAIGPGEYETERLRRVFGKSAPLEGLDADLLRGSVQRITIRKRRASPSLEKRQELRKMFRLCRKGEIDLILTRSLTTFSQTVCNAIITIWELQALNIPVIFEKENISTVLPTRKHSSVSMLPSQRQKAAPIER